MACNCGKKQTEFNYLFTSPDGKTKTYTSKVQADAAKVRAGGGTVQAVKR
jgi:hypothetical protein